jgi:hypothetical protein
MKTLGIIVAAVAGSFVYPFADAPKAAAIVIQSETGAIIYIAAVQVTMSEDMQDRLKAFGDTYLKNTGIEYELQKGEDTVQLAFAFPSYTAFKKFAGGGSDSASARNVTGKEGAFFNEYTVTIEDPYARFFDDTAGNHAAELLTAFNTTFNTAATKQMDHEFVYAASFRYTSTNAYKAVQTETGWNYHFKLTDNSPATMFERRANRALWYAVAVAATAGFMGVMYLALRKKHKESKAAD